MSLRPRRELALAVSAPASGWAGPRAVALPSLTDRPHLSRSSRYGQVDVVCPNAGITEAAPFEPITSKDGKRASTARRSSAPDTSHWSRLTVLPLTPRATSHLATTVLQPDYLTLNITLIGAIHTSVLALHFFANQPTSATSSLKSLVITGSMASFTGVGGNAPPAPLYSVSKAGKLGLVQGLRESCREDGVRVSLINPFFTKTKILPDGFEVDERIGESNWI